MMEEQPPTPAAGVVERSASHFLTRDADGWALWSTDQDDDDPLLTFPASEAGAERALSAFRIRSRESRRVRALGYVATLSGVCLLILHVGSVLFEHVFVDSGSSSEDGFQGLVDTFSRNVEIFSVISAGIGVSDGPLRGGCRLVRDRVAAATMAARGVVAVPDGDPEVLGKSRSHVLILDVDGYSIWDQRSDAEEPVRGFPETDEGSDAAWECFYSLTARARRGRVRGSVAWVAVAIGGAWIVYALIVLVIAVAILAGLIDDGPLPGGLLDRVVRSLPVLYVLPPAFMACAGLYVVLWLRDRDVRA